MTRLAELQTRIGTMSELRELVGAMRLLAGMRLQEAQKALPGIRSYADSMATAIGQALLLAPQGGAAPAPAQGRRGLVLFAAEHGFVGAFTERLLDEVDKTHRPDDVLFLLGSRATTWATERAIRPAWSAPMASRLTGVPETVRRLTASVYGHLARGEIEGLDVLFARSRSGRMPNLQRQQLLPLDLSMLTLSGAHHPPLHNLDPELLVEKLGAEYVLALLSEAAVESLASENAARFAAMTAAHDNVTQRLEGLRQMARQARQDEITTELLDLATGMEALPEKISLLY